MTLVTETMLRAMLAKGIPNPYSIMHNDKLTPAAKDFLKSRGIRLSVQEQGDSAEDRIGDSGAPRIPRIPVGVSNRHVHLSPEDVERLFGKGYALSPWRELSQKGQYAAEEKVSLLGPKGALHGVRVLGPARGQSQVEISRTDGFLLGIHAPVRLSGDLSGTPGMILEGPEGRIALTEGVIVAKNHVHLSPEEARTFGVGGGDRMMLRTLGDRPVTYCDVIVRIHPSFSLDFHVDTDEANAGHLNTGDAVELAGVNGVLLAGGLRGG